MYLFYSHPDANRARIRWAVKFILDFISQFLIILLNFSQFLILPPFGRKGHGSRLLRSIYNDLNVMKNVRDITGMC